MKKIKEVQIITNFDRVHGYPVVKLMIGEKTIFMLLDTGFRECVLDVSFYNECGVNPEIKYPTDPICGPFWKIEAIEKKLCALTIGNIEMRIPVAFADIKKNLTMIADELDLPLAGILGSEFFNWHKICIDFDNEMIYSSEDFQKNKGRDAFLKKYGLRPIWIGIVKEEE